MSAPEFCHLIIFYGTERVARLHSSSWTYTNMGIYRTNTIRAITAIFRAITVIFTPNTVKSRENAVIL